MRPSYETPHDLMRQQGVADHLADVWSCQFIKTPRYYEFDYTICRGPDVLAFAEVKCRSKQFDTLMLSLHKWTAGVKTHEITGKPFLLIVSTPNGIYRHRVTRKPMQISFGGRTDRGDSEDREPCVMIPYADMVKV